MLLIVGVTLAMYAAAQDDFERFRQSINSNFEAERSRTEHEFEQHRAEVNRRYADHLRRAWGEYDASPSEVAPLRPEPVEVPHYKPCADENGSNRIETTEVVVAPTIPAAPAAPVAPATPSTPVAPATPATDLAPTVGQNPHAATSRAVSVEFFGCLLKIRVPESGVPMLFDLTEERIAAAWKSLAESGYEVSLEDCRSNSMRLQLGDWGYARLVKQFAERHYEACCNDAVLMQAYLLTNVGYKVRLARVNNTMYLLLNIAEQVYGMPFYTIDGRRYYFTDGPVAPPKMQICDVEFPQEQALSLTMQCPPRLPLRATQGARFASRRYPNVEVRISVNRNLMEFYASYPSFSLVANVQASLSEPLKEQLYPVLRRATDGLAPVKAVGVILDFVQTAFAYKSDTQQFGCEKWFFGDEMFYYPFCDCDDRAVLFAVLVRELLGLDVVLLDCPEHVATAVALAGDEPGDYVMLDGRRYTICDPTYIGAEVGRAMPSTGNIKIVKL